VPLAHERLEEHGDGRLRYRFKRAWRNGTYAVQLDPLDLIARRVALIPPPRFHMLRYHGVLAAHAKARAEVVPGHATSSPSEPLQLGLAFDAARSEPPSESPSERASRHPWAWLLARVFAIDVTVCPHPTT
jgi:Putative transposase